MLGQCEPKSEVKCCRHKRELRASAWLGQNHRRMRLEILERDSLWGELLE